MSAMIIAPITYLDSASIQDKSSQKATLPASNVLMDQPRDAWRTLDNSDAHIVIDLGASKSHNTVGVLYSNADSSATVRIRAADTVADLTSASPGPDLDSTVRTFQHRSDLSDFFSRFHHVYNYTSVTTRYVRLDFASLSGLSYLQVGNIVIADAVDGLEPRHGFSVQTQDFSGQTDTMGTLFGTVGKKRRVLQFTMPSNTDANMWDKLFKLDAITDGDRPMLYSIDPGNASYEMFWTVFGLSLPKMLTRTLIDVTDRQRDQVHEIEFP